MMMDKLSQAMKFIDDSVTRCDVCHKPYVIGKTHRCEYTSETAVTVDTPLTDDEWNRYTRIADELRKHPLDTRTRTEMRDEDPCQLEPNHRW